jgi:hypothetical protein
MSEFSWTYGEIAGIATAVYTPAYLISLFITNLFDTPERPVDGAHWYTQVWYWLYRVAEVIRGIAERTKQRPDVAARLLEVSKKARTQDLSTEEIAQITEDLAFVLGKKQRAPTPPPAES